MKRAMLPGAAAAALCLGLAACRNPYDAGERALAGGVIGAGSGAAIGAIAAGGTGAAIGATVGGAFGTVAGVLTSPGAGSPPPR